MRATPGQLFAAELERRKIGKSEFARQIGRVYQTVNNWTLDKGFLLPQRAEAARGLGLPPDHFDRPNLAQQRENYRRQVLAEFRDTDFGAGLSDEEWRCIQAIPFPQDMLPTIVKYEGIVLVYRGVISAEQFRRNIEENEHADRSIRAERATKRAKQTGKRRVASR